MSTTEPTTHAEEIREYLRLARRGVDLAERAHDESNARDAARAVWAVDTCYFEASKLTEYVGPGDMAEVDTMMDDMDEYVVRAEELAMSVPGAREKIRAARWAAARSALVAERDALVAFILAEGMCSDEEWQQAAYRLAEVTDEIAVHDAREAVRS